MRRRDVLKYTSGPMTDDLFREIVADCCSILRTNGANRAANALRAGCEAMLSEIKWLEEELLIEQER